MKNLNLCQWVGKAGFAGLSVITGSFATGTAQTGTTLTSISSISQGFANIYCSLMGVLPPLAMVLVILAAVIYAAGQVGGAEFRANAGRWATALIVGAVLALVLVLLLPGILGAIDASHSASYSITC